MSVEIKLEDLMGGITFHSYRKPCVYAWKRRAQWLYIGKSTNGLIRIIGRHHVINVKEQVRLGDSFLVYWIPDDKPDDHLEFVEEKLINLYKPKYNQQKNPNYERPTAEDKVFRLWKRIPTKNELAKILFKPVQERQLLEKPSNSQGGTNEMIRQEGLIIEAQRAWDMLGYTNITNPPSPANASAPLEPPDASTPKP